MGCVLTCELVHIHFLHFCAGWHSYIPDILNFRKSPDSSFGTCWLDGLFAYSIMNMTLFSYVVVLIWFTLFLIYWSVDVSDAEIYCGTRECDLKDWNFKYFSLPRRNNPYGLEFWSSICLKDLVSNKFTLFLVNLTFGW